MIFCMRLLKAFDMAIMHTYLCVIMRYSGLSTVIWWWTESHFFWNGVLINFMHRNTRREFNQTASILLHIHLHFILSWISIASDVMKTSYIIHTYFKKRLSCVYLFYSPYFIWENVRWVGLFAVLAKKIIMKITNANKDYNFGQPPEWEQNCMGEFSTIRALSFAGMV